MDVLYSEGRETQRKIEEAREALLQKEAKECTFQPALFKPPKRVVPKYRGNFIFGHFFHYVIYIYICGVNSFSRAEKSFVNGINVTSIRPPVGIWLQVEVKKANEGGRRKK